MHFYLYGFEGTTFYSNRFEQVKVQDINLSFFSYHPIVGFMIDFNYFFINWNTHFYYKDIIRHTISIGIPMYRGS